MTNNSCDYYTEVQLGSTVFCDVMLQCCGPKVTKERSAFIIKGYFFICLTFKYKGSMCL